MTEPRRKGRKPSLARDDVLRAALAEGLLTMSMPAVARRLGVRHPTLYRYVLNRDELVLAALDLAVREFDWPPADLSWRELVPAFADALWRFLELHPGMAETVQMTPRAHGRIIELTAPYGAKLRADGLSTSDAVVTFDLLVGLTMATEIAVRRQSQMLETAKRLRSIRELYEDSWGTTVAGDPGLFDGLTTGGRGWLANKLAILLEGIAGRVGEPATRLTSTENPTSGAIPDRSDIAVASRALARQEGLHAVTVQSVADRLGVAQCAVVAEVGNRDGLFATMLDAVAEDIDVPTPDADPRAEVVALALAVDQALRTDRWVVLAVAVDGLASPSLRPLRDRMATAFRSAGVPDADCAVVTSAVWGHVLGVALAAEHTDMLAARMVRSANAPTIDTVAPGSQDNQDLSRKGLEALVDGLLRRHAVADNPS